MGGDTEDENPPKWQERVGKVELPELDRVSLSLLREGEGYSQRQLADQLAEKGGKRKTQGFVSHFERTGLDTAISKLERVLAPMGGKVRLIVEFEDGRAVELAKHTSRNANQL